jgi:hypothetical protein
MAIITSGPLSLNAIHIEAGGSSGTSVTINDADIRGLTPAAGKSINTASGSIISFSDLYGASSLVTQSGTFFPTSTTVLDSKTAPVSYINNTSFSSRIGAATKVYNAYQADGTDGVNDSTDFRVSFSDIATKWAAFSGTPVATASDIQVNSFLIEIWERVLCYRYSSGTITSTRERVRFEPQGVDSSGNLVDLINPLYSAGGGTNDINIISDGTTGYEARDATWSYSSHFDLSAADLSNWVANGCNIRITRPLGEAGYYYNPALAGIRVTIDAEQL